MKKLQMGAVTTALFCLLLFGFAAFWLLTPDQAYSLSERRQLRQLPEFNAESVSTGRYMQEFSSYMADQFPERETFRSMKAKLVFNLYGQRDNNGIYFENGSIGKLEFPTKPESIDRFTSRIEFVCNRYLAGNDRIFFGMIPDKNYYLAVPNGYPALDYAAMTERLKTTLGDRMTVVKLTDCLTSDDYYHTDSHWRNEKLQPVRDKLAQAMGFSDRVTDEKKQLTLDVPFLGVYAGQAALPLSAETIVYVTDPAIEGARVQDLDRGKTGGIYWGEGDERDRYSFFLNGSSSLLTIENPLDNSGRSLVIFRDSFGSALAPWLVEAYGKITLVDIRYLPPEMVGSFVDFSDCDVLFLYSASVINNSETIK